MYGGDGSTWTFLVLFCLLGMTFGVWKLVELLIWVFSHIHWA